MFGYRFIRAIPILLIYSGKNGLENLALSDSSRNESKIRIAHHCHHQKDEYKLPETEKLRGQ